ncbi:F-box/LRR-repeat protein 14 [Silene latifolia]|uniref:F-box/LRR-repeat protein 14 n=1 Tax=Silene latifolia TaxID=37657 RepID=UPI003D776D28
MDALPDQLILEVIERITTTADRNAVSLTCKHFHELENEQRQCLRVGCGLKPANEALNTLCHRFPNLIKVEIIYSGWMSKLGKQLDDRGLLNLSKSCPSLMDLTLSFCTYITDAGVGYLASCLNLSSLKLNFAPRITGCGILSVVVGCKKLSVLHLIRCLNVNGSEWIDCLGKLERIEYLSIKNCRAIGEGDLIRLGPSWRNLKFFEFEVDSNYRYMKLYDRIAVDRWNKQSIPCESMVEMSLVNCMVSPGRGLACVLGQCLNLQKIHMDMCVGLRDGDILDLSRAAQSLRSISLRIPSDFSVPLLISHRLTLTDGSLKALAENCPMLECVKISFADGDFPSLSSFSVEGIINLVRSCPIRELSLDHVYSFSDLGMEALCSAAFLETLELVKCQEISDDGLQFVAQFPQLSVLRLCRCLGVTDDGFKQLKGTGKLEFLSVEDCPQVSESGLQGTAKKVSFRQDLSWMH